MGIIDIKQFFKDHLITIKGHLKGWMRDGNRHENPIDTVFDSLNVDFQPGYDGRRDPYLLFKTLVDKLPNFYSIGNYYFKTFVDKAGNEKDCIIVISTPSKSGLKTKIFIWGYYAPPEGWDNSYKAGSFTSGFNDEWIELTERYKGYDSYLPENVTTFNTVNTTIGGIVYSLISPEARFNKPQNYFKGFFVCNGAGDMIGIVSASLRYTDGFTYFAIEKQAGAAITHDIGLMRFAINQLNKDAFLAMSNPPNPPLEGGAVNYGEFVEFPNAVHICFGDDSRLLIIDFIGERTIFGGFVANKPFTYAPSSHRDWLDSKGNFSNDHAITYQVRLKSKTSFLYPPFQPHFILLFEWKLSTSSTWRDLVNGSITSVNYTIDASSNSVNFDVTVAFQDGLSLQFTGKWDDFAINDMATITVSESSANAKWDGFYFDGETPEVLNKKLFTVLTQDGTIDLGTDYISKELGIRYKVTRRAQSINAGQDAKIKIYSLGLELDDYQTIYITEFYTNWHNHSGTNYEEPLTIECYFEKWFNRRITGHLLFFNEGRGNNFEGVLDRRDVELPPSYLVDDFIPGYFKLDKAGSVINTGTGNAYKITVIDNAYDSTTDPNGNTSVRLMTHATGLMLDSVLNEYHRKEIKAGFKHVIRIGQSILGINLSPDSIEDEKKQTLGGAKNVKNRIVLSAVQSGPNNSVIETPSIYGFDRTLQIMAGDDLVGGAIVTGQQFLLFTESQAMWYEIIDAKSMSFRPIASFPNKGAYSNMAIRSAVIEERNATGSITKKFGGVFWNNPTSFYRFYNNEANDIMDGRLRLYYQSLSDDVKRGCIIGFYANRKEMYAMLGDELWVYNLVLDQWKRYKFPALSNHNNVHFAPHPDGEMYFSNDSNRLFRTAMVGTFEYLDEGSIVIEAWAEQYLNNGTSVQNKIPDRLDMIFDNILVDPSQPARIDLQISKNDTDDPQQLNKAGFDVSKGKISLLTVFRSRCNWYKFYWHTADANFKQFRITQININAKFAGRIGKQI